ncbi:hypothetical protein RIF29_19194 [Crotalaria pallida]|uniref:Protein kinase domain-containing protein n=1 Tax=Crotalaria pallida TaxID=3830 RepID=A0AAN9IB73_CROPI
MAENTHFFQPSREVVVDGNFAWYKADATHRLFAVKVCKDDSDCDFLLQRFVNISCKTHSPRILHGEFYKGYKPPDSRSKSNKDYTCYYLVYENAQPLADVNNHSFYRLCIRDILEGIYDVHNKHRMCHNNISNDRDAIVVSKSGGKLGAIKGCQGRCFNHVGRDLVDLRDVVSRHLNLGSGNPNKFLQFLRDLRYKPRYFAPATPFRLLAGHPIWMSPAARMHIRYAFYNKLKRLPAIDQRNFRKGCRHRIMLQRLQFGGWKSFAMNHDILKDVLTFHHKSRERDNEERNDDSYVDADETYLDSLSQGDRQEKLIMSFLRFARNCACHITSLSASAIEELLEENWPNLLCAAYDLIVSDSHSSLYGVLCQKLGTFTWKFGWGCGNLVGDDHPLPSVAEA